MKVEDMYETPMLIGDHDFDPTIDDYDLTKMRDKPRTFSAGKDSAGRL